MGTILLMGAGKGTVSSGVVLDAATTAWINAVVADGGSVSAIQQSRVNDLVVGLKADSLFSIGDRLWLWGGESDLHQAKIDIINLQSITINGSPTLAAGGYTGNGTSDFIDLNFNPSTAGGNYAASSASFGTYVRGTTTNVSEMGAFTGSIDNRLIPSFASVVAIFEINTDAQDTPASTTEQGYWVESRTGANAVEYFKNGASFSTGTQTQRGLVNLKFYALAENNNGTASGFSPNQQASVWFGGGLTTTQGSNLSTRVNTYMTAWGINVY